MVAQLFRTRLRSICAKNVSKKESVEDRLGKLLEKVSAHLVGLFFDLGENRAVELTGGTPYDLKIIVVYDASPSLSLSTPFPGQARRKPA